MLKKVKKMKEMVFENSAESISIACDIYSLSNILYDYCSYNLDSKTDNLVTLAEILKEKSVSLINKIDSESINISKI